MTENESTNESPKKLKRSMIRCRKCGDQLESRHIHDLKECKCGGVALDGGLVDPRYIWKNGEKEEWIEDLSEWVCIDVHISPAEKANKTNEKKMANYELEKEVDKGTREGNDTVADSEITERRVSTNCAENASFVDGAVEYLSYHEQNIYPARILAKQPNGDPYRHGFQSMFYYGLKYVRSDDLSDERAITQEMFLEHGLRLLREKARMQESTPDTLEKYLREIDRAEVYKALLSNKKRPAKSVTDEEEDNEKNEQPRKKRSVSL